MINRTRKRALLLVAAVVIITGASTRLNADTGMCGGASITLPFVDVSSANVFFTAQSGKFYQIVPSQPPVPVTTVTSSLGATSTGIAFDGQRIWTANLGGSVSIVTLSRVNVTNVTAGFSGPQGIVCDGANI